MTKFKNEQISEEKPIALIEKLNAVKFTKLLLDWQGWKKDLKKFALVLATIFLLAVLGWGAVVWLDQNVTGLRLKLGISKVQYQTYTHLAPNFSFKFPAHFVADSDEQKRYGEAYLGGFRLQGDQRTGCDVRSNPVGINFQKSDQEIHEAVSKDLAAHVKDFKEISAKRTTIGFEKAYLVDFSFTDPLGNSVRVSQAITSHQGSSYLFVCGTGQYQYDFFAADFADFFKSFRWGK